jgi:beta-N-acetylhexosaminidase
MIPAFLGLAGPALDETERVFFRSVDPAGYILFRRNCVDRAQLRALTDDLRALSGRDDLPILIDQEGGRVQRMTAPEWLKLPSAESFARLYERAPVSAMEAVRLNARAISIMLREVGINVDCLPLLDVRRPHADAIIGDRSLGSDPMQVAALGRMVIDGLREGGVVGVVKHIPGHGRAMADSHKALPLIDAPLAALEEDFAPFVTLSNAPMGMTAHVVYTALDPDACATLSATVIGGTIRGRIGFTGLLMSDDIGMSALSGDFGERAAGVIAAGCDIALHCSGEMAEMEAVAGALGVILADAKARLDAAMATIAVAVPGGDFAEFAAKRDALLALV